MNPWILASRPKTLFAAFAPVLMGCGLAVADQAFHAPLAVAALLAAVCIQVGTNFWNDYADFKQGADTKERKGPQRAVASGLIPPAAMRNASFLMFGIALAIALYLYVVVGWVILVIGAASVLCGFWYTTGRWSLAYLGIADLFVVVFFGPVAVAGTYFVQAGTVDPYVILSGFPPGLIATGLLAINNLRDIDEDRAANKKTPAVRFGRAFVRWEYIFCMVTAVIIPVVAHVWFAYYEAWVMLASLVILPAAPLVKTVLTQTTGEALNPALGKTAMLLMAYSVLFAVGVNL